MGAVEPRRGCDGITSVYLKDRGACIAASLKLDSSHIDLYWVEARVLLDKVGTQLDHPAVL
ncbi:hypothetical protein J1G35_06495, partial [Pseudomonas sp. SH10-3B]|uniref:hypothetical protein n=1 Tax=Pseudomonas sp. SH10-3B TaxID=2816049 RepID=UPI001CA660CD